MGHKDECTIVGCKVLHMCNAEAVGSNGGESKDSSEKGGRNGERRRAISLMKELLRWAAATKTNKGGSKGWKALHFRNRVAAKDPLDDSSSNSSRISFKWDVGSCSMTSSVYSPLSVAPSSRNDAVRTKHRSDPAINTQNSEIEVMAMSSPKAQDCIRTSQWITTDADFVVLEL